MSNADTPFGTPQGTAPDAIDLALGAALRKPELPQGFHAALMAQVAAERAAGLADQRLALAREHEQGLQDLRRGYLRMRQDTLLTVVVGAFSFGAAAAVGLPSLAQWTGLDLATLVAWICGGLALAAAVTAVRQRTRLLG